MNETEILTAKQGLSPQTAAGLESNSQARKIYHFFDLWIY
jgi:hypothetical protein